MTSGSRSTVRRLRRRLPRGLRRALLRTAQAAGLRRPPAAPAPAAVEPPRPTPVIPPVRRPELPVGRPDVTAAVILDPFSEAAFGAEWRQLTFNKGNWRDVLTRERPDLLFAESAWTGRREKWRYTMTAADAPRQALRELVTWCREQGIPTVFWNKEDPPNYDRFLETARLFDYVFTVDATCLPRYRADLGHDRLGVLPFAAQPRIHNPVLSAEGRMHDVAFAGTYFAEKHPRRREQMATVLEPATAFDLHIYSRNENAEERYRFPARYSRHVVGTLPYEEMLSAYKAYKVFLNVNSVTDSPSTCARRVFELAACATPVVSGWSAGIEEVFGDRVAIAHDQDSARALIGAYLRNTELRDRTAHRAQRLVLTEHTYAHRVDTVLRAVGIPATRPRQTVSVVAGVDDPARLEALLRHVARQRHRDLELVVATGAGLAEPDVRDRAEAAGVLDVIVVPPAGGAVALDAAVDAATGAFVATMDHSCWYGPHYLTDLVHAFGYTDAGVVGKRAHYVHHEGLDAAVLRHRHGEHRYGRRLHPATIVARRDVATRIRFGEDAATFVERCTADGVAVYAADRYSFVDLTRSRRGSRTPLEDYAPVLAADGELLHFGPPEPHVTVA